MSFLAPLFLLGAAAAALPVIFHLIRRTTRERTLFSSLRFLPPSPPRVTRRSRLEDLLLLALRCLVLALLALGFARPFLKSSVAIDASGRPPAREVILVDQSASMRRPGLWDAAIERAVDRARQAAAGDEVAVVAFDLSARPVITFAEWNASLPGERHALAESRLKALEPGWGATRLDEALAAASELLVENSEPGELGPRRVVLISDLQEGSRLDGLQNFEWPKGIEVDPQPVKPRAAGNAGLQLIADSAALPTTTQSLVRVRVVNSPDSEVGQFQVAWENPETGAIVGKAEEVLIPPGQTRVAALAAPEGLESARLILRGDAADFDNRVFLVPPRSSPLRAVYLGEDSPNDPAQPLFYLLRAMPPSGRLAVEVTNVAPNAALTADLLEEASIFIVADAPTEDNVLALEREIRAGKTLLVLPRTPAVLSAMAPLFGLPELPASEATVRNYAMLGHIAFEHPLLAPFADPRFSDFTKIHFWKHRTFDDRLIPESRSIWRFDSGDPALVEAPVGRGRVLLLSTTWRPVDSQLALSTKFVPLLLSMIELGVARADDPSRVLSVGDPLALPRPASQDLRVRLPDGGEATLPAGQSAFTATTMPGIYTIEIPGEAPAVFAVNMDPAESRTLPLLVETLETFGAPLRSGSTAGEPLPRDRQLRLAAAEAENRQKLWRWLIVTALGVLLIESAVAGRQGRRLVTAKESAP